MTVESISLRARYRGEYLELGILLLKNFVLTVLTLGIYHAWARAATRRFVWSRIQVGADSLHFSGTGLETFLGYLKISIILVGYWVLSVFGPSLLGPSFLLFGIWIVMGVLFAGLLPWLLYNVRRYRYSRTSYRQIRFGIHSVDQETFLELASLGILTVLTLGIYYPFARHRYEEIVVSRTTYGSLPFHYDGKASELWAIYVKGSLLTLVTFGFAYPFFIASRIRYIVSHTRIGQVKLRSEVSGVEIFFNRIIGPFLVAISLGLLLPWLLNRHYGVLVNPVFIDGSIDFAEVRQTASRASAAGDSLADALDIGDGL